MSGENKPTELVAALIDNESSFKEGIRKVQETIDGSCTMLILRPREFMRFVTVTAGPRCL